MSWSGDRSKQIAEMLSDWLCCVIQATKPWISTRDLDRGSLWFGEINDQLKDTSVGIICLTQENKNRPWVLFEAGALAKGLSSSRVCTFLIDLEPQDIEDPLAQFNHTFPDKASMLGLVKTLNNSLDVRLDSKILEKVFDMYWSNFEKDFKHILSKTKTEEVTPPRSDSDILSEILKNTRMTDRRIRSLEFEVDLLKSTKSVSTILGREERSINPILLEKAADLLKSGMSEDQVVSILTTDISPLRARNIVLHAKKKH